MKRIAIAACLLLTCLSCKADPTTLPDSPNQNDRLAILAKTDDGNVIGVDLDNMRYDKQHNIVEFLEVILDGKSQQIISSKLSFACWDHKVSNPMITVVRMQDRKVIHQEKLNASYKPISSNSWLAEEYQAICPKIKDPRATEL
jgi:hypothetical protein